MNGVMAETKKKAGKPVRVSVIIPVYNEIRSVEEPIIYHGRTEGEGKKIRWRDGNEAVWPLLRYRFIQ